MGDDLLRGFVASEPAKVSQSAGCPYPLPEGVTLLHYTRIASPVPVTVCSIVADVPKFIKRALAELEARLHNPVQIKGGDSVFELLSKLGDCGLELCLEWPERTPAMSSEQAQITDKDVPF